MNRIKRISIRNCLFVIFLASVILAFVSDKLNRFRIEASALRAIVPSLPNQIDWEQIGEPGLYSIGPNGDVRYRAEKIPRFLEITSWCFGDETNFRISGISVWTLSFDDSDLKHLVKIRSLERLALRNTRVSENNLKELANLRSLEELLIEEMGHPHFIEHQFDKRLAELKQLLPNCKIQKDGRLGLGNFPL